LAIAAILGTLLLFSVFVFKVLIVGTFINFVGEGGGGVIVGISVNGGGEDRVGWGGCGIGKGDTDGGGGKGLLVEMLVFGRGGMVKVFVNTSELIGI
jgi:hypothetical protein